MKVGTWLVLALCLAAVCPVISAQSTPSTPSTDSTPTPQRARIERLLTAIERSDGLRFERNGTRVNAADAVRFLRAKWARMAPTVNTPESFIEQVASRSSTTGQPYRVCTGAASQDIVCTDAGPWLKALLSRLEPARTPSP